MIIECPWPPNQLSQNARIHWAARAKAVKSYRNTCYALARIKAIKIDWDGPIHFFIDFYPPDRRRYDDDNIAGRFKAGRDGIAQALMVDDNRFVQHPYLHLGSEAVFGGKVVVRIAKEK